MRANVNIARKQRHTLTLENFKGVDLSSSPLRVATSRASYMRNLWSENGANHKRPGWRELFRLDGKINGVFPFEEGSAEVLLVHAGTKLYRVIQMQGVWGQAKLREGLENTSSQCFYRDGRAYIIGCGAYLVYGSFDGEYVLKDVSEIAYVPTTTVSIGAVGSGDTQRASLDGVNLLTAWRKNRLDSTSTSAYYELDAGVMPSQKVTVALQVSQSVLVEGQSGTAGAIYATYEGEVILSVMPCAPDEIDGYTTPDVAQTKIKKIQGSSWSEVWASEFVEKTGVYCNVSTDGQVKIVGQHKGAEVLFCSDVDLKDKITSCCVGAVFGVDGASDRLFLSGNPDEKGVDRWSEADDFTYFPDGNVMFVGGGESAVTGYARLSDGMLAVFKEEKAGYPTIYYRTGAKTTMTDADGAQVPQEYFPVKAGMAGDGLVTPRAMANLSGDPLILTASGVFGVELSQNVASGERYTRERSRAIREELRQKDLAGAVAIAHRGRYYLSTGDGICYVADARYKTTFEGSPDTGYEWWVWDNIPATAFAEYTDSLLFGTAEGRVCAFEEGTFADRTYIRAEGGDLLGNADENYVTYGNIEVNEGDILVIGGNRYRVTLLDAVEKHFSLTDEEGNAVDFENGFLTGVIEHSAPVVAEWASAVMDLGTSMARKTLLSLSVTLEPGVRGATQITLETRDGSQQFSMEGQGGSQQIRAHNEHGLDFGALDFGDISFTRSFVASTTMRTNLRNFNFILLRMRSDTPTDMAVSGVTLEYKINQTNRGYY